ncbi:hypothetical protein AVEN_111057-1 [Araneus ventricosus]|uniref:Uncharacterized protein n=1 Tax=Araneus ventricosus TaxID=182803 RepID=A0A4Y2DMA4_ARAVE|nr:hypothetical protein AVEN_111057-1 [Araneus ventricosus]
MVKDFYASHKIHWRFIVEKAAWWGGFYERLIRSVKLALRKILGKTTLSREELEILLIEIEGVLNSRPLTYVFSEFQEPVPLTPAHMLLGRRVNSLPLARLTIDSNLSNRKMVIKRFNYRERLTNNFWNKWSKEYLLMLRSTHYVKPAGIAREFKVNDIVLINDDKLAIWGGNASKNAYAACVLVRTKSASGVQLHRAKSRMVPSKSVLMPRLELLTCCVGARLANSIRNSIDISDLSITYWTDPPLNKEPWEWSIFVSNHVKEIGTIASPENWQHVPGRMNPAHLLSCGCSPRQLLECKWFEGPERLLELYEYTKYILKLGL